MSLQHGALRAALALGLGVAAACRGERWLIGDPRESADAGAAARLDAASASCGPAQPALPELTRPPNLSAGHAGRWVARLLGTEAAKFPAAQLRLELGPERAQLRFETGSAPPRVQSAGGGYLCTAPGAATCTSEAGFVGGFDYTLSGIATRGSILSLGLFLDEPWDEWCGLQAPVPQEDLGCNPLYDVEPSYDQTSWEATCAVRRGDAWYGIDCDRLATVERHACVCSELGCRAAERLQELHVRLVAPDELEGALWFAPDRAQVLRFEREAAGAAP